MEIRFLTINKGRADWLSPSKLNHSCSIAAFAPNTPSNAVATATITLRTIFHTSLFILFMGIGLFMD